MNELTKYIHKIKNRIVCVLVELLGLGKGIKECDVAFVLTETTICKSITISYITNDKIGNKHIFGMKNCWKKN